MSTRTKHSTCFGACDSVQIWETCMINLMKSSNASLSMETCLRLALWTADVESSYLCITMQRMSIPKWLDWLIIISIAFLKV